MDVLGHRTAPYKSTPPCGKWWWWKRLWTLPPISCGSLGWYKPMWTMCNLEWFEIGQPPSPLTIAVDIGAIAPTICARLAANKYFFFANPKCHLCTGVGTLCTDLSNSRKWRGSQVLDPPSASVSTFLSLKQHQHPLCYLLYPCKKNRHHAKHPMRSCLRRTMLHYKCLNYWLGGLDYHFLE